MANFFPFHMLLENTDPVEEADQAEEQSEEQSEGQSNLIKRLVSDRKAADTAATRSQLEAFEDIQTAHRKLDPLRTDEIYLFGITVEVGVGSLTIRCRDINLNPNLSEEIESANGTYLIRIPIFRGLTKRGTKLATARTRIQKRFLRYAKPYWYVCKKDMSALRDEVFALIALADELRAEAIDLYDTEFAKFLATLEQVLIKAGNFDRDRLEYLLELYSNQFPTRQEILSNFGVTLEGPIRIPSLVEEAATNADLAEQLAREAAAKLHHEAIEAQRETQEREEQAVRDLQDHYIKSLQESFARGIQQAQDDAYGLLADLLGSIERIEDPSRLNGNLKKRLEAKLQQLQTAVNQVAAINNGQLDPKLPEFAEKVRQLKVLTTSSVSPERLKERLEALRSTMTEELEQVFSSPKRGHRALAKWMLIEDEQEQ